MQVHLKGKRIVLIIFMIIVITFLHYFTTIQLPHFHAIYANAYYVPIILAAFWYGLKGGLITSIGISLIYLPSVMFQWGGIQNLGRFLEIIMFNVVSSLVALLVQRIHVQKDEYQQTAMELEQSFEKLEKQTERLLEMEDQLRTMDRMAVVGELSANVVQEMRDPLASIRSTIDTFRKEFHPNTKQMEFLQIFVKEVNRLNQVVENYLDLAKPKRQRMTDQNLTDIIQSVADLVSLKARKAGIELIVIKPSQPISVFTDENLMRQVLLNVILNAMASIEDGGRIVISPSTEKHAAVASSIDHIYAKVKISDTGIGIPESEKEKVFQPFYTSQSERTGLGLAIARRAIQQLNGEISLESKENVGTIVTILIPCAEEKKEEPWKKSHERR
jgi:signal transduction histidine kinase